MRMERLLLNAWSMSKLMALVTVLVLAACGGREATESSGSETNGAGGGANASTGAMGGASAGGAGAGGGLGGGTVGSGACAYPGIPHPADMLPGGIMPTLPTPNAVSGFPYDPCTIAAPAPEAATTSYVVAVGGDDATAGNDGNGTVAEPRATIPEGTFGPGTVITIYGDNSPYGTVDFNMGNESDWTFDCTAAEPCFVVGIDQPRLGRRINISNSRHLIIDGVSVVDIPGGSRPWGNLRFASSQYMTLRNTEVRGDGTNSSGGAVVTMSDVEYMVTFRTKIHSAGSWASNATGLDVHGWRPAYGNRYLWLLDSELYHLQADGVQTGNSNNGNPQSESSHYVFIGGNLFYENYENALDNKNSYHVIFSSNEVRTHYAAADGGGANNTAIILSNNSEGPWTGYHWAINNRIHDSGLAIRDSGSEDDEKNFIVGNVVWDVGTAFVQANNSANRELWVINNTASGSSTAFDAYQPGSNASLFLRGNIFHDAGAIDTLSAIDAQLVDNILFSTSQGGQWDVESGNSTADPILGAPSSGDMTPAAGSPAIDGTQEDPVYALFASLYGLDIRRDLLGTPRPSGAWDIGAVQTP